MTFAASVMTTFPPPAARTYFDSASSTVSPLLTSTGSADTRVGGSDDSDGTWMKADASFPSRSVIV